jgi:hypothetical protein
MSSRPSTSPAFAEARGKANREKEISGNPGCHLRKDATLMKRGNVSSRESKNKPDPIIIRARVNDIKPEPVRVLHSTQVPEVGDRFQGVPTRHGTKNTFQKTLRVLDITDDDGVKTFICTTA